MKSEPAIQPVHTTGASDAPFITRALNHRCRHTGETVPMPETVADARPARQALDPLPGIIPFASINLLAGAPGVGKTALSAWMLSRFRDCLPIFGRQPNPLAQVAFIGADRSWSSTGQWFAAAGYGDIPHYSLPDDRGYPKKKLRAKGARIEVLKHCFDQLDKTYGLPWGSLVQVDPIALFMGGNLIDYDACMVACLEMREICQERGLTIFGTAHSSKQKADKKEQYARLQDRILGSAALFGFSDTQMYLAAPQETGEKHYTFLWHPHHEPGEVFPLGRNAAGLFVPWAESTAAADEGKLLHHIPSEGEGIGFGQLVLACEGVSKATVHRYLQEQVKLGTVEKTTHGHYRKRAVN
jgi:hypothetical protein